MHGRILQFALAQIELAEIYQHSRRIAAGPDGSLNEGALIFPIKSARKRSHSQEGKPKRERDLDEHDCRSLPCCACKLKSGREKEKRASYINPMLGNRCVQRENAAHR